MSFNISETISKMVKRRQLMNELQSLDRRQLEDMGISSADFERIVRESF